MISLRRKKKEKKALQAQVEAQQAIIAALQGNTYAPPKLKRPPSTLSVPVMLHEDEFENFEQSGSDQDVEPYDSVSLTGTTEYYQQKQALEHDYTQSLPVPTTLTYPPQQPQPQPQPQLQPQPPPPVAPIGNLTRDYGLRRGISQPNVIPVTSVPVIMDMTYSREGTTVPTSVLQQPRTKTTVETSQKRPKTKQIDPVKQELIDNAVSFGLGRGIDATNKTPWINKSSFQVRRVHNSVIETNEGGISMNYDHEVLSISEMEDQFQSSINPPESPVTIHVEDEMDRCVSSSRRLIGRRVVNCSIGFQADIEERYTDGDIPRNGRDSYLVPHDPAEVVSNTQLSGYNFEERVCQWLIQRIAHKSALANHKFDMRSEESPTDQLAKMLHAKIINRVEEEIKAGCLDLVQALRITHYITKIQLGATEYRVMSDGEYHKKVAQGGAFGMDTLATAALDQNMKQTKKEAGKCSQVRKIGVIGEDNKVKKEDEIVLNVEVQPITRLIRLPVVKAAISSALEKYMERTASSEGGPFVIKCTGKDIYLTVNRFNNYEVEGTDIPSEASLFYFQSTDDGGDPFEFHIVYYGEDLDPGDSEPSTIGRFLEAPINTKGQCPGPLLMKHSVKVRNTRFTLRSRLSKKHSKSHLMEWIAGEDAFYIACATKKFQHGSYIAIKNSTRSDIIGKHLFMTACVPSIHNHTGDNVFLLFELLSKNVVLNKQDAGRETPGKIPVKLSETPKRTLINSSEIETRQSVDKNSVKTTPPQQPVIKTTQEKSKKDKKKN